MVNKAKAAIVQEAKKKEDLKQFPKNYQDRVYQVGVYGQCCVVLEYIRNCSIYIHTYIHTYTHTYTHACLHTYIHTYIYTYIYDNILLSNDNRTILFVWIAKNGNDKKDSI